MAYGRYSPRGRKRRRTSTKVTEKKAKRFYMNNKKLLVIPALVAMFAGYFGIPKIKPLLSKAGVNLPF